MTPLLLQNQLCDELETIFDGYKYYSPSGERVPLHIFKQNLPQNTVTVDEFGEEQDGQDEDPMPFVIVRMQAGKYPSQDQASYYSRQQIGDAYYAVRIVFIVGTCDASPNNWGYVDSQNIIDKIIERFKRNPVIGAFQFTGAYDWNYQDDTYAPYNYEALEMQFKVPEIKREDPLA